MGRGSACWEWCAVAGFPGARPEAHRNRSVAFLLFELTCVLGGDKCSSVANQDNTNKTKVVSKVSDPPALSTADLSRIQQEFAQLYAAFTARTASMEILTGDDLKVRAK